MSSKVRELAKLKHEEKGQLYDDLNYVVHLDGVVGVIKEFLSSHPCLQMLIDLGYLHDTKEDTDITDKEILSVTNHVVLDLVNLLTDKEGNNRTERHLNTYCLIRECEDAVLGKVSDRIFNIRRCLLNKSKKGKMYCIKEGQTFKSALYDPRHQYAQVLWKEYDRLISVYKNENSKVCCGIRN